MKQCLLLCPLLIVLGACSTESPGTSATSDPEKASSNATAAHVIPAGIAPDGLQPYCHADICLGQPVATLTNVTWDAERSERGRSVYARKIEREPTLADTVAIDVRQVFPTADADATEAISIAYPLALKDVAGLGGTWKIDDQTQPAYARLNQVCHQIRLRGWTQDEAGHEVTVELLPVLAEDGQSTFVVSDLYWKRDDVFFETPEAEALFADLQERYGEVRTKTAHVKTPFGPVGYDVMYNSGTPLGLPMRVSLRHPRFYDVGEKSIPALEKAWAPRIASLRAQPGC